MPSLKKIPHSPYLQTHTQGKKQKQQQINKGRKAKIKTQ